MCFLQTQHSWKRFLSPQCKPNKQLHALHNSCNLTRFFEWCGHGVQWSPQNSKRNSAFPSCGSFASIQVFLHCGDSRCSNSAGFRVARGDCSYTLKITSFTFQVENCRLKPTRTDFESGSCTGFYLILQLQNPGSSALDYLPDLLLFSRFLKRRMLCCNSGTEFSPIAAGSNKDRSNFYAISLESVSSVLGEMLTLLHLTDWRWIWGPKKSN